MTKHIEHSPDFELKNVGMLVVLGLASWAVVLGLGVLVWNGIKTLFGAI